ncbi:uncharacterized protein [Apostichopus japonicus]|uniref:uncharacterized protein n=1 Tax=Stichopus japonicus TaxID=307972 RepID=UPI003AB36F95
MIPKMHLLCIIVTLMTLTSLGMTSSEVDTASDLPRTKIRRAWYSGFMGYINLPISEDVDFGWKMILDFRRRIKYFEICGAQVENVTEDRRRFYLVNETWDGIFSKGDILRMFFAADTFPNVRGQVATIQFYPITSPPGTPDEVPTELPQGTNRVTTGLSDVDTTTTGSLRTSTLASLNSTSVGVSTLSTTETVVSTSSMTSLPVAESTRSTTMTPSTTVSGYVCKKTCSSTTAVNSEWSGNFGGELSIPISNGVIGGWEATIWFQNRVTSLQIYNARAGSSVTTEGGETVYTITNQSWNYELSSGSSLYLTFIASIPTSQSAQTFYVHMDGQPLCSCDAP